MTAREVVMCREQIIKRRRDEAKFLARVHGNEVKEDDDEIEEAKMTEDQLQRSREATKRVLNNLNKAKDGK